MPGPIDLALAGAGVLGGLQNSAAARNSTNKGLNYFTQAANTAGASYRRLVDTYNTAVANGDYDPNEAIDLANRTAAAVYRTQAGNMGAQYSRLGYKPGDSAIEDDQSALSEKSRLGLEDKQIALRDAYGRRKMSDVGALSQAGNAYAGTLTGLGDRYTRIGDQQASQGGLGGVISAFGGGDLNFLKPRKSIGTNSRMYDSPIGPTMPSLGGNYAGAGYGTQGPDQSYNW